MTQTTQQPFRVATWNVNSLRVRLSHVLSWLEQNPMDIIGLQETKTEDVSFPVAALNEAGYHVCFSGQKTYNGVAILCRHAPEHTVTGIPGFDDPQRRFIAADIDGIHFVNLYVPNGEHPGSEKYKYKLDWLNHVTGYLRDALAKHDRVVVVGDFNIAPEDRDVHDPEKWRDRILCSKEERAAFDTVTAAGLIDAFRRFHDGNEHFSWWDYRAAAYRRKMGLRIDHILCSESLVRTATDCWIDVAPRGWERPSDHTPVVASFIYGDDR